MSSYCRFSVHVWLAVAIGFHISSTVCIKLFDITFSTTGYNSLGYSLILASFL